MQTLTATSLSQTPLELPAPAIEALASRLQGRLLIPGNADYERRRHVASAEENPELFWGLRGGGGNFGVVTGFTFRLHPVGPEVMFSATFYPAEIGREVLGAYRDFTEQAPESVSSFAICGTIPEEPDYPQAAHGKPYVLLAACYAGDPGEGERVTARLRGLDEPLTDFSGVMPFVEVQQLLDGDYPQGRHYYWKSRYLRRFDDAAIERLLELAAERPSALSTVDVWHLGGAMARQDGGPTAFENRDAPFLLGVESNWDEPGDSATNIAWTREACERFAPFSDERGYLNFEPAEAGSVERAFADHHERLRRLKRDWDPDNLFRLNHNIAPAE